MSFAEDNCSVCLHIHLIPNNNYNKNVTSITWKGHNYPDDLQLSYNIVRAYFLWYHFVFKFHDIITAIM